MGRWLSRILLGVAFVGAVCLALVEPAIQGQAPANLSLALPFMVRKAAITVAPAYRDYVGLFYAPSEGGGLGAYYTVRGDGSALHAITPQGVAWAPDGWSPNGAYLIYRKLGTTNLIRLSDGMVIATFPNIYEGSLWSPDSRFIFFYRTNDSVALYDVQSQTLTTSVESPGFPSLIEWSADSRHVAWLTEGAQPDLGELWLWNRDRVAPQFQGKGHIPYGFPYQLYWSPDGTRIALNGLTAEPPYQSQVLVSEVNKAGIETILEGYQLHGWVQEGERLFVQQGGQIYLAAADGSEVVPFSDPTHDLSYVAVYPKGDHLLYIFNQVQYIHRVGELSPIALAPAFCMNISDCFEYYDWRPDGERFIYMYGISDRGGTWSSLDVGDVTVTPPRYVARMEENGVPIQFLPLAENYLAISDFRGGYPAPSYEYSYIYNGSTDERWLVPYELNGTIPIEAWRYIP